MELPGTGEHSYQFAISDGAFGWLPALLLNFVHNWRSGPFENELRGPTHLDDARRSDNGKAADAVGGWYDAGDVRKWMVHSNLPALAFMDAHERLPWHYAEWERVDEGWSPWLLEALWGLDFMLKMQDPATGMFFEDVGGGGNSRKRPGMSLSLIHICPAAQSMGGEISRRCSGSSATSPWAPRPLTVAARNRMRISRASVE